MSPNSQISSLPAVFGSMALPFRYPLPLTYCIPLGTCSTTRSFLISGPLLYARATTTRSRSFSTGSFWLLMTFISAGYTTTSMRLFNSLPSGVVFGDFGSLSPMPTAIIFFSATPSSLSRTARARALAADSAWLSLNPFFLPPFVFCCAGGRSIGMHFEPHLVCGILPHIGQHICKASLSPRSSSSGRGTGTEQPGAGQREDHRLYGLGVLGHLPWINRGEGILRGKELGVVAGETVPESCRTVNMLALRHSRWQVWQRTSSGLAAVWSCFETSIRWHPAQVDSRSRVWNGSRV